MNEMRSLSIWLLKDTYYLQAYSTTIDGIRYTADNPVHIIHQSEVDRLGQEILETVKECKFGIIDNIDDKVIRKNFYSLLGVKSEKELMRKGKMVSVCVKADHVKISPTYFNGKSMSHIKEKLISSLNPDEITKTVLEAFERCHP